jgi:UDP-2-acetamido-3-amino-2,3-dideoxy-glucuronate N-acetyltransferase
MMKKRICVIGGGRWGKNHIRTLASLNYLAAIVETNAERLDELLKQYPNVAGYTNVDAAIDTYYDGYTVAAPAELHYSIGKKLIEKGLNVLLEKPMTMTAQESKELVELAKKTGSRLMVGHVLLFHPAILKIKEVIESGKLGKLFYLYSTRLNLGTVRTEESAFASLAPHDISVLDYLIGSPACKMEAKGSKFLQNKIYDTTLAQLEYPNNVHAHIFVSWLHPFKQRLLVVIGSKGMISFDDSSQEKIIHFYNKRVDFKNGIPVQIENPDEIIPYDNKMPLDEELKYFVEHLNSSIEINTGEDGYEVVKVLETVQKLVESDGK